VQFLFVSRTPIWAGILVGVLVEFFALMLWAQPHYRAMYGTFIVLLSLLSFITSDFGGLFVGMLLGIFGGSLALAWTPVAGKTKRQQRWLMKTRGEQPAAVAATTSVASAEHVIVLDEPASVEIVAPTGVVEDEPTPAEDIEVYIWDLPAVESVQPEVVIEREIEAEKADATSEIDVRDQSIDLRDGANAPDSQDQSVAIDLTEEKALTAPPEIDDEGRTIGTTDE
jgi:hypothetical protein